MKSINQIFQKNSLSITVLSLLSFSYLFTPNVSFAGPFTCEAKLYQSIDNKLMLLDPITGTYSQIGSSATQTYNAIGWDQRSNYIYGFKKADKQLFRLDTTGQITNLGVAREYGTGRLITARSQSADMDENGNLWIYDRFEPKKLTRINVDTLRYKKVNFVGATPDSPNDIVYIASAQSLFGINKDSNKLIRFNLVNHTITSFDIVGLPPQDLSVSGYGAGWTNINNDLYFAYNNGGVYRIDNYLSTNPTATWIIDSEPTSQQDGASCPVAQDVFVPPPTTGNGTLRYADSGNGEYKDRILFMDWKNSSIEDGIQDGDVVNFTIPADSGLPNATLTATFRNLDDPENIAYKTVPSEMKTWNGASFYHLYDTPGAGEAIYTPQINEGNTAQESHLSFDIDWEMTIDGQTVAPDILFMDAESTTLDEERMDITTNGGVWSIIENAVNESYIVDGVGTNQIQVRDTEDPDIDDDNPTSTEGSPLLLSKGATQTSVSFNTINFDSGRQAVSFALLVPRDHGDAIASYGDAVHAFVEEAIAPPKNQLGLQFTEGTPYFGTAPDSESSAQQDPLPAMGDDNNEDAFDSTRGDDENIEIPQLALGRTVEISVPVHGSGFIQAWVDWNADGDFGDANEQVVTNLAVNTGTTTITLNVPADAAIGQSYARFRISTLQNLQSTGYAKDGEVEDIAIEISDVSACRIDDITENLYSTSSVSANSTSLTSGTRVYQAKFDSSNWEGHVMAHDLETTDNDGGVKSLKWDAANEIARINRKIFTYTPYPYNGQNRGGVEFTWETLNDQQRAILENGEGSSQGIKRHTWVRGGSDDEGTLFRTRNTILGDIIHSNLLYKDKLANYDYSKLPEGDTYLAFLGQKLLKNSILYVGSNDGMLHAFNADTGSELFSYIPNEIFPKLVTISDLMYGCNGAGCLPHQYLVDGKLALGDAYFTSSSDWHTILLGGLGKGGKAIFALDVTNSSTFTKDDVLWEISSTQATSASASAALFTDHLGDSIPSASVIRTNSSNANERWAAVVANGYNSANHQAVLFIIDVETGDLIKMINTGSGTEANPNGLSSPIAVDSNNDSIADRIYAGDLHGNLWAFDISDSDSTNWDVDFSGTPLFSASQPITAQPQVGVNPIGGLMIYFGTGKYFDVSDNFSDAPSVNTYYGIHDNGSPVNPNTLVEQSILQQGNASGTALNARITSTHSVNYNTQHGWYMDLPTDGERVISQALLRQGRLIFTTMTPSRNICEWGGTSWLMEFDAIEGKRLKDIPFDINNDKQFTDADNVVYQGDKTIVSGIQDISLGLVYSSPAVIEHTSNVEGKYLSGTGGSIGMFRESASRTSGRISWKQLK